MKEISLLQDQCHHSTAQTIHSFQGSAKILDDNDTAFLQKLSSSSSRPFIDSPHVIVLSNGTTIILQKMGPVHTIVLAKQFTHSRAPNVVLWYKIWTTMTPPSCRNYHPRRRVPSSIRRMWLCSTTVQPSSCERWDPYIPSFSPNNSLIASSDHWKKRDFFL